MSSVLLASCSQESIQKQKDTTFFGANITDTANRIWDSSIAFLQQKLVNLLIFEFSCHLHRTVACRVDLLGLPMQGLNTTFCYVHVLQVYIWHNLKFKEHIRKLFAVSHLFVHKLVFDFIAPILFQFFIDAIFHLLVAWYLCVSVNECFITHCGYRLNIIFILYS